MTSPYIPPPELTRWEGNCLIWLGGTQKSGHPLWKSKSPARLLFEQHHGRPPIIRKLVSLCGNRMCIAPLHHADNVADVIAARVRRTETGCLEWTGLRVKGYGWMQLGGEHIRPHRAVWEQSNGPIPSGLVIDHLCNNPACCEIDHLRCVTQGENGRAPHSNSPAGVNVRKTHCIRGHAFDAENTYVDKNGGRHCRACRAFQPSQTAEGQRSRRRRK